MLKQMLALGEMLQRRKDWKHPAVSSGLGYKYEMEVLGIAVYWSALDLSTSDISVKLYMVIWYCTLSFCGHFFIQKFMTAAVRERRTWFLFSIWDFMQDSTSFFPMLFFSGVMNLLTFVKETTWYNYLKCFRLESSNVVLCIVSLEIIYTCVVVWFLLYRKKWFHFHI